MRRWALACAAAMGLLAVLVLLLSETETRSSSDPLRRSEGGTGDDVVLRGGGPVSKRNTAPSSHSTQASEVDREREVRLHSYEVEVLDYRALGVAGVVVFIERDIYGYEDRKRFHRWRVLDQGITSDRGLVRLMVDPRQREDLGDGLNRRLRIEPPAEREDLAPTWRLWKPEATYTYRLQQSHVIEGTVVNGNGDGVADAMVFLGSLPSGGYKVMNPEWYSAKTNGEGRFRFAGVITTRDGKIDVWAVGPGKAAPPSSAEVRNAVAVALDERSVVLRLP